MRWWTRSELKSVLERGGFGTVAYFGAYDPAIHAGAADRLVAVAQLSDVPQWRIDREIVFNTGPVGTAVFAAPVNTTGSAFESGVPQRLPFPPSMGVTTTPQSTPDGQRFLIEVPLDQPAARTSISVVLNWPALVKQ
jgi:hypothetical protein